MQANQIDLAMFEWSMLAKVGPQQLLASLSSHSCAKTMQEKRHPQISKFWVILWVLESPCRMALWH